MKLLNFLFFTLCLSLLFSTVTIALESNGRNFLAEYVKVDVPNEAKKITIEGCVTPQNSYVISKFEVTNIEYANFLNSVARIDDPYKLYSPLMADHFWGGIVRFGSPGAYSYKVKKGYETLPVTFVSWTDATRFTNWLNYGRPNSGMSEYGTTEGDQHWGAYNTIGNSRVASIRNPSARYFIPSCGEWILAGFYDKSLHKITQYVGGDHPPASGKSDYLVRAANYYENQWAEPYPHLVPVNAFPANRSSYGTYNQAGNVMEWVDSVTNNLQMALGGSLFMPLDTLKVNYKDSELASKKLSSFGFRVAGLTSILNDKHLFTSVSLGEEIEAPKKDNVALHQDGGWSLIDRPGNFSDIKTGRGCVPYSYEIMKNEITNSEYADFLNSVASIADPHKLYVPDMANGVIGGISRTKGDGHTFKYFVKVGYEHRPVAYMSWFSLARYANWHHFNRPKGLETIGVTEGDLVFGAYDTSHFDEFVKNKSNKVTRDLFLRNKLAKYFIPNDDEWYKSAYYDPTRSGIRKYWNFPNRSNLPPSNNIHSSGSANYQVETLGEGSPYFVSRVGDFKSGGYFKVNDLGGNLWEWVEDWRGLGGEKCWRCDIPTKGLRGGSFNYINTGLLNSNVDPGFPSDHYFVYGGRLARRLDHRSDLVNQCVPIHYRKAAVQRLQQIIDKVPE